MKTTNATLNSYELTYRAMNLMDSIRCGPSPYTCDGAKPVFTCPNHGGEVLDSDDNEREIDQRARETFERRWSTEVAR